ncbi:MAG: bifunctional hydroxymethylpyrimidine kinase/phosphomethylpyrimidine kinase [Filomicrobium sp.]
MVEDPGEVRTAGGAVDEQSRQRPVALTVAGSDPSGGAGIQADLKTFTVHGVYGASVVTALTAQNSVGVRGVHDVPSEFVSDQLAAVRDDLPVAAMKTGMLARAEVIEAVADGLRGEAWIGGRPKLVVDPVMVATSGDVLLEADAVALLKADLFPLADLVTPNLHEAAHLCGCAPATSLAEMVEQGQRLLAEGAAAVLIKGGHLQVGDGAASSVDVLVEADGSREFGSPRVVSRHTHGSGCTLSAAIAANLACGHSLVDAIARAKAFVTAAIQSAAAAPVGSGRAPLDHFAKSGGTH